MLAVVPSPNAEIDRSGAFPGWMESFCRREFEPRSSVRRGHAGGTAKSEARWIRFKFTRPEGLLAWWASAATAGFADAPHRSAPAS
jgi:hypothetical protein